MLDILNEIMISLSLSMDAFSLALLYGTMKLEKKKRIVLSIIVGLFHFCMPLIGLHFGDFLLDKLFIAPHVAVAIIFFIISIDMIHSSREEATELRLLNWVGMLLFAFSVSLDSLSIGIGLPIVTNNTFRCVTLFSIISGISTYLGLKLGTKLNLKYGNYAKLIGGIILLLLSICYLFHH